MRRLLILLASVLTLAAGGVAWLTPDPAPPEARVPTGFQHAYAMHDCAPWDGPAIAIYLTERPWGVKLPRPHYRIAIWLGDLRDGQVLRLNESEGRNPTGAATYCDGMGCRPLDARVVIRQFRPDHSIEGELFWPLDDATGREFALPFRAEWRKHTPLCG